MSSTAGWQLEAERIARAAGQVLLQRAAELRGHLPEFKGRRELVTQADRDSERIVVEGLQHAFPDHAILAEEGVLTPRGRVDRDAEWLWMVDPLDGTTNFVHGVPFYCVALSLSYRDQLRLAVVHAPALGATFTARHGEGAWRNGERLRVTATEHLADALVATGFSYVRSEPGYDDNCGRLARIVPVCRDLRRLGSAQLDLCLTAAATFDAYWEMYLQPYDVAAGGLIVREAGGMVTDLAGGEQWVRSGDVLATNGRLHAQMLALVGGTPPRGIS